MSQDTEQEKKSEGAEEAGAQGAEDRESVIPPCWGGGCQAQVNVGVMAALAALVGGLAGLCAALLCRNRGTEAPKEPGADKE